MDNNEVVNMRVATADHLSCSELERRWGDYLLLFSNCCLLLKAVCGGPLCAMTLHMAIVSSSSWEQLACGLEKAASILANPRKKVSLMLPLSCFLATVWASGCYMWQYRGLKIKGSIPQSPCIMRWRLPTEWLLGRQYEEKCELCARNKSLWWRKKLEQLEWKGEHSSIGSF